MAARKPQDSLRSRVRDLLGGRVRRDASNETIQGEKAATEKNGLAEPPSYDEIASDDRKLDPIVRNTHHNHLRSPLVRLPDALLVRLMSALDLDTLLTLRHTSRDFMRLFSTEPVFAKHHLDAFPEQGRWTYTALVWAPPSDAFPRQAAHRPGSWCSACLERHPETPSLYCSLCKTSLEGACFSEFARHESFTDADRICLGHQLALRVCEHTALHYQQVRHMGTRGGAMDHACRPPRSVEGRRCTAARCRDGKTGIQCYKREGSGGTMQLEVGSSVHIKFKRLPSGRMCPASIRGELAAARGMGRGVGRQWMAGGRCFPWVDPMRAFDPNVCDCVEWVPAGAASGSHARWQAACAARLGCRGRLHERGRPLRVEAARLRRGARGCRGQR
ncbi:Cyclin-like F-box [Cordyceps fumosorosea ARSEF 2679]|uniref:Cyclin-like F-box n=1 Tax=Cordyceps fumosorosea (strain ARSEF 2679) TaxID=1081104 RepID=A0A162I8Z4_CORFA|nr:Cyclin-like F-box [Cordyceps fumosorosea ARSEF 2679]OAA53875.1 Cyclin-like F-box [Cordyceps fumosorosea ARSEF 2679]